MLFTLVSLFPAIFGILQTRDLFDPRVFLLVYWLSYTSQLSIYFLQSGVLPSGVVQAHVSSVLTCAAASSIAFTGVSAAVVRPSKTRVNGEKRQEIACISRDLSFLLMVVFSVAIMLYALRFGGLEFHKAEHRDGRSHETASVYRLLVVSTMLTSMVAISLDAQVAEFGRSRVRGVLAMLLCQIVWCWFLSERNVVLIAVLVAAMYRCRRLLHIRVFALGVACFMLYFVQLDRSTTSQQQELDSGAVSEYVTTKGLPRFSASLTVFTNVVDLIPRRNDYFFGASYLTSLQTFLPGDPLGARERSIATWFPEHYYFQGSTGVDFAVDAEAYANFGWIGPPFVFALLCLVLSLLYSRRREFGLASVLYPVVVLIFLGAIRTNSQTTFKMIVGAFAFCFLLIFIAKVANRSRGLAGHG
ncbi:O-antigen polymerase [Rhodopirellula sallentina]|uniref:O-antigen polymerase n=1 Tax=Rhodopirellula sallentina TaxID=1263869 RepID=UPI001360B285